MRTILGQTYAQVVAVQTTPTRLDGGANRPPTGRLSVAISNTSGSTVYLGGAEVTVAQGYPLVAGAETSLDAAHGAVWAIAAATTNINILEGY